MRIKSLVVIAVLITAIFGLGGIVNAQSTDNSALIAQLQAQIAQLMAQLQTLQGQQGTTQAWCHTFNTNLGFANSGSSATNNDIVALHTILQKENIDSGSEKGSNLYGEDTSAAVVQFQQKYGITPLSGYVGPKTRTKLNSLYGCGINTNPISTPTPTMPNSTPTPPASSIPPSNSASSDITVLSPSSTQTSGNVVFASTSPNNLVTQWNSSTPSQAVDISIIDAASFKTMSAFVFKNIQPSCSTPTACTQSFGMSIAPGVISDGSYFVQVCSAGTSNCGKSQTFQFSNTAASIKIIFPNGGETLTKGQTYNIQWQSSGIDTVNINLMTNYGNNTSQSPFFQTIASAVPASSSSYSWTVPSSIPAGSNYNIGIGKNQIGAFSDGYFTIVASTTTPTTCTPNWNCGAWNTCINGQQTRTCTDGNNCGVTTGQPSLTQACTTSTTSNYSITVTSPNGGETYNIQKDSADGRFKVSIPITWNSSGLPTGNGLVHVKLLQGGNVVYDTGSSGTGIVGIVNKGNYTLIVDTNYYNITPGSNFKVEVYYPGDQYHPANWGDDTSDSYFTIIASATICTPNWNCSAWSTCANSQQTRTCTDSNNCGVVTGQPNLTQTCTGSTTSNYSITVTSPNGGETYNIQKNTVNGHSEVSIPITWTSSGLPTGNGCVKIQLLQGSSVADDVTGAGSGIVCIPNQGQYTLILNELNNITPGNNFKVRVYYPGDQYHPANWGDDTSDSYFTIASSTTGFNFSQSSLASISDALAKIAQEIQSLISH